MVSVQLYGTAVQSNDFISAYILDSFKKNGVEAEVEIIDAVDDILAYGVASIPSLMYNDTILAVPGNGDIERTVRRFVRDILHEKELVLPEIVVGVDAARIDYDLMLYALRLAIDLEYNIRVVLAEDIDIVPIEKAVDMLESSMLEDISEKPFIFYERSDSIRSLKSFRKCQKSLVLLRDGVPCTMYSESCGKIVVPKDTVEMYPSKVAVLQHFMKTNPDNAILGYSQRKNASIEVVSEIDTSHLSKYDFLIGVCSCSILKKMEKV